MLDVTMKSKKKTGRREKKAFCMKRLIFIKPTPPDPRMM